MKEQDKVKEKYYVQDCGSIRKKISYFVHIQHYQTNTRISEDMYTSFDI